MGTGDIDQDGHVWIALCIFPFGEFNESNDSALLHLPRRALPTFLHRQQQRSISLEKFNLLEINGLVFSGNIKKLWLNIQGLTSISIL